MLYCCGDLVLFSEDTLQERFVEADMQTSFASLGRRMTVAHSALYHRKSVFSHARFDATFRIAGDYDFLAKTWQRPEQGCNLGFTVTRMSDGGCSHNEENFKIALSEKIRARRHRICYLRLPLLLLDDCNDRMFGLKRRIEPLVYKNIYGEKGIERAFIIA